MPESQQRLSPFDLAAFFLLFTVSVGLTGLVGCGSSTKAEVGVALSERAVSDAPVPLNRAVAVLYHNGQGAEAVAVRRGAEIEAEQRDVALEWLEVDDNDADAQAKLLEQAIQEGYVAICLCPLATDRFSELVDQAEAKGIPVVLFERPLNQIPPDDPNQHPFASVDHFHSGQILAELAARELNEEGVVLILGSADTRTLEDRKQGILFTLKGFGKIDAHDGLTRRRADEKGVDDIASLLGDLDKFGEQSDIGSVAFISLDGAIIPEVIDWVKSELKEGVTGRVYGFGTEGDAVDLIRAGALSGTVVEDPQMLGMSMIMTVADILEGNQEGDGRVGLITSGGHLVTSDNIDDEEIARLLESQGSP